MNFGVVVVVDFWKYSGMCKPWIPGCFSPPKQPWNEANAYNIRFHSSVVVKGTSNSNIIKSEFISDQKT